MKSNEIYLEYLRKSREDLDYEKNNTEYKTLERHKERLKIISDSSRKPITPENIYEEVVSGDSISERPEIQRLLKNIENVNVKGVWVIDVQRLCRGDLGDQDKIIKTFKYSNTLILTPEKEYDLSNPADEEYLIDKLSYSRKEYNNIKKRLNEGRLDSVRSGLFCYGKSAYGYERYKLKGEKGWSLKIIPDQAEIVRMIFKMCLDGMGTFSIANHLNKQGIKTINGKEWKKNGIREMLHNKVYAGYVTWQERKTIAVIENGSISKKIIRQKEGDYLITKGRHEAIINEEDFNLVQEKLKACSTKYVKSTKELKNPLAGIIRCSMCGRVMARRQNSATCYYRPRLSKTNPIYYESKDLIYCTHKCKNMSHTLEYVEDSLINSLKEWLKENKLILKDYDKKENNIIDTITNQVEILNNELEKEEKKLDRLRDLLEDGIYDKITYLERSKSIEECICTLKAKIDEMSLKNEKTRMDKLKILIPKVEMCIKDYSNMSIKEKNEMLHSILEKVLYTKTKSRKECDLKLDLYMKI